MSADPIAELKRQMQVAPVDLRWERLFVTSLVPDAGFYEMPMPTDEDPLADSGKRQLLCSPATWEHLKATVPPFDEAQLGAVFGLPVVIDGA